MPKYRQRQLEIEAMQWTGENFKELKEFTNGQIRIRNVEPGVIAFEIMAADGLYSRIAVYDYVVKDISGFFYPMKERLFYQTFELFGEEAKTK